MIKKKSLPITLRGRRVLGRAARESAASGRPDLVQHLSGLEKQIAGASSALRSTLRALDRPSAPAGALAVKLREDVAGFTGRTGVPAHLLVLGEPQPIDEQREDLLVRVVQEGLRNVERHAAAHEVVLTLAFAPGSVEVVVQDDGVGVSGATGVNGVGLGMLREELARFGGDTRLVRNDDAGATMRTRLSLR